MGLSHDSDKMKKIVLKHITRPARALKIAQKALEIIQITKYTFQCSDYAKEALAEIRKTMEGKE